jgi:tRNA pseudouridine38-40 synthase
LIRIRAIISYDGSQFSGFQKQKKLTRTVASDIEYALLGLGIECNIIGAGRTDSGVHATGQVIHFDAPDFWSDIDKLKAELNRKLRDIAIKKLIAVDDNFHARFGAKNREYKYCFSTKKQTVFMKNYISLYDNFETQKLMAALGAFEGEHDFKLFCKSGSEVGSTVRNVTSCRYRKYKNINIITIRANGFLRSQVRMMVDISMKYAMGKLEFKDILNQINCKEKISTTLAPAKGLYLTKVIY